MEDTFYESLAAFLTDGINTALNNLRKDNPIYDQLNTELAEVSMRLQALADPEMQMKLLTQNIEILQKMQEYEQPWLYLQGMKDCLKLEGIFKNNPESVQFAQKFINGKYDLP